MQTVSLTPLYHRGQENIAIHFKKEASLDFIVRRLSSVRWSQTNKCWYVPLSKQLYLEACQAFKEKAVIDSAELKAYLEKRKQIEATIPEKKLIPPQIAASPAWKLSMENLAALQKFVEQLKLKAYSPSTIKTYRNEFLQLLQVLKKKAVTDLTTDDLRRYFIYCFEKLKLTENTLHSRINAIKFYFLPRWI